ncbi:hypothetical protein MRX96_040607 [Rhipicephalus microplus]
MDSRDRLCNTVVVQWTLIGQETPLLKATSEKKEAVTSLWTAILENKKALRSASHPRTEDGEKSRLGRRYHCESCDYEARFPALLKRHLWGLPAIQQLRTVRRLVVDAATAATFVTMRLTTCPI